ncbi:hypothetical protein [Aquabacterium sp. OR-4]|uniref:hypothetical protein n=1 Tax=Aquabacterium sp. OR-4 TaxID=2978127 RepID=UPI0028C66CAA|nr:hypothetical protein [Aquabacterium sp. OR-4]MDT7836883.1 hypothetical protein [Aquabacterium sp. OR-4]
MPSLPPSFTLPALRRQLRPAFAGLVALSAIIGAAVVVAAQPSPLLSDPTRPPAAVAAAAAAAVAGPAASGRVQPAGAGLAVARSDAAAPALRLQSLRMPAKGPASALIDGREVKLGDAVGERVVAAIDADGVLLRGSAARAGDTSGDRRLRLLGGDEKQPPGTIQITRSARWQPQAEPLPADAALAGAPVPPRAAPVSLAERTRP